MIEKEPTIKRLNEFLRQNSNVIRTVSKHEQLAYEQRNICIFFCMIVDRIIESMDDIQSRIARIHEPPR
jgi:hypothetical protein